jgi:hypothetical protein
MSTTPTVPVPPASLVPTRGRSVLAVLSVPLVFLLTPLGLALAVLARRDIRRTGRKGANWAMAGLVLNGAAIAFDVLVFHRLPMPF